jgi:hypothetical protein
MPMSSHDLILQFINQPACLDARAPLEAVFFCEGREAKAGGERSCADLPTAPVGPRCYRSRWMRWWLGSRFTKNDFRAGWGPSRCPVEQ